MSIFVDIEKSFGDFLLKVKFEAADETLALLGASGCGKSMTLKCIAGIESPDRGRIVVDDTVFFDSDSKINMSPQERRTGLMFQNYALFPNMTVLQNIQAGARREKNKNKRETAVSEIMDSFGLAELAGHYPHQLSGGQQQRVALARILVSAPRILLLDEPFSALDSHLRFQMEQEVRRAVRSFGKTVIMVSHDREEVYRMADSIAVMDNGSVEAVGAKEEVFRDPQTRSGALLTGCRNISAAKKIGERRIFASDWGIQLDVSGDPENVSYVGVRMREIKQGGGPNSFRCKTVEVIENTFSYTVMLRPVGADGEPVGWELGKDEWEAICCDEPEISVPPESVLLLR